MNMNMKTKKKTHSSGRKEERQKNWTKLMRLHYFYKRNLNMHDDEKETTSEQSVASSCVHVLSLVEWYISFKDEN